MKLTVAAVTLALLLPASSARADSVGLASVVIDLSRLSFSGIAIDLFSSQGFIQYLLPPQSQNQAFLGSQLDLSSDVGGAGRVHTSVTAVTTDVALSSSAAHTVEEGRVRPLSDAQRSGSFVAVETGVLTISAPFSIEATVSTDFQDESTLAVAHASISLVTDVLAGLDSWTLELGLGPDFAGLHALRNVSLENYGPLQVLTTDVGPSHHTVLAGILSASAFFNAGQTGRFAAEALSITEAAVPEPSSIALAGLGLAIALGLRRSRAYRAPRRVLATGGHVALPRSSHDE